MKFDNKVKIALGLFIVGTVVLLWPTKKEEISELPATGIQADLEIQLNANKSDVQRDDTVEGARTVDYEITVKNATRCLQTSMDAMLVFDTSGSMSSLLSDAKEAGQAFLDNLDFSKDQIGLVTYADTATVSQELTSSKSDIEGAIQAASAAGLTNIGDGIMKAKEELTSDRRRTDTVPVIIIFTDGRANRPLGMDASEYAISASNDAKSLGIRIISIAYGAYADIELMRSIASGGSDNYFWAENGVDMVRIYSAISESLQGNSPDTEVLVDLSQVVDKIEVEDILYDGIFTQDQLQWNLGTLQCQETAFLEFSIFVKDTAQDLDRIDLIANLSNSTGSSISSDNAVVTVHAPRFSIHKTDHVQEVTPGSAIQYELAIENAGTGNAYDVIVEDILPKEYLILDETSISGDGSLEEERIVWDNNGEGFDMSGTFEPSSGYNSLNFSFGGTVRKDLDPGLFTMINVVRLKTGSGYIQEARDDTSIPYAPDLSITKSSSPQNFTNPGGEITYMITVENLGGLSATGVEVVDTYDSQVLSVDLEDGIAQGNTINWSLDSLEPGETKEFSYGAIVANSLDSNYNIQNEASVSSNEPDINYSNNVTTNEILASIDPVLNIEKTTQNTSFSLDSDIPFKITITNDSYADSYSTILEEDLLNGFEYILGSTKLDNVEFTDPAGTNKLVWNLGYLAQGETFEVDFLLRASRDGEEGNYVNTARIRWQNEEGVAFGPAQDEVVITLVEGTQKTETVTEDEENIFEVVTGSIRSAWNSLIKAGENKVYLKVVLGLALALPLPLMLIFDKKLFNKLRKRSDSRKKNGSKNKGTKR